MRQRQPRVRDRGFIAWLHEQPCCVHRVGHPVEAAHIRMASVAHGKRSTGLQERPDDRWCVPLCAAEHRLGPKSQHAMNEADYWKMVGVDPFAVAARLYSEYRRQNPERADPAPSPKPRTVKRPAKPKKPSRPIKSASQWPPKGSRKLQGRKSW